MIFREIYGEKKTEQEIWIIAHTVLAGARQAFLRTEVLRKKTGYDFFVKKQRDEFLDKLIDNVIQI